MLDLPSTGQVFVYACLVCSNGKCDISFLLENKKQINKQLNLARAAKNDFPILRIEEEDGLELVKAEVLVTDVSQVKPKCDSYKMSIKPAGSSYAVDIYEDDKIERELGNANIIELDE